MIAQKTGNNTTWYYYDGDGTREAIEYGGNVYYYFYNAQGDVVGLFDNNLNVVVEYSYDSWGNVLSITGSLANTLGQDNPFRYRGYYFDSDTGLYYLNSRYYDANVGRLINTDTYEILGKQTNLYDKNLFAYCDNNPIIRIDAGGYIWETVFDVASLGLSIIEVAVNPADPWAWAGLAGDTLDLIPFVTGVGEITRGVKVSRKIISSSDNVIDAAKTTRKIASTSTGSYEIIFKSGKNYVGKGSFNRAMKSAKVKSNKYADEVVSISWKSAKNTNDAFLDEYFMQKVRGVNNPNTYNKIWSPGRKQYSLNLKYIF